MTKKYVIKWDDLQHVKKMEILHDIYPKFHNQTYYEIMNMVGLDTVYDCSFEIEIVPAFDKKWRRSNKKLTPQLRDKNSLASQNDRYFS